VVIVGCGSGGVSCGFWLFFLFDFGWFLRCFCCKFSWILVDLGCGLGGWWLWVDFGCEIIFYWVYGLWIQTKREERHRKMIF